MAKSVNKVYKRIKTPSGKTKLVLDTKEVTTNATKGSNTKTIPVKGNAARLKWQQNLNEMNIKKAEIAGKTFNRAQAIQQIGQAANSLIGISSTVKQNTNGGISTDNSPGRDEDSSSSDVSNGGWIL